jgi:hypothetical protein
VWRDEQQAAVLALVASGLSDREASRRSGVPRATVGHWRRTAATRRSRRPQRDWRPSDPAGYCYLLGVYLGDGHIVRSGRAARLCISLDPSHPGVAADVRHALTVVFPDRPVRTYRSAVGGKLELRLSDPSLPAAFPQCGPGRKHERAIVLEPWQRELTHAHPRALLRGLIHSDGCRAVNRFTTRLPSGRRASYEYPRYFFSNRSADIRAIFCDHCDRIGVHWTLSNPRNVSVARRDSVALLDEFVGPKR